MVAALKKENIATQDPDVRLFILRLLKTYAAYGRPTYELCTIYYLPHGLLNYIDNKAKCRDLKNCPVKGLEIHSVMLVFSIQLCELLPL
jgi:hypothetical protein